MRWLTHLMMALFDILKCASVYIQGYNI